jgi:uncharacterized protein (TIGR02246 family)
MLRATEGSGCRHTEGTMAARTPEDLDRLFTEHMAAGDVDAIVALYEPGGVLVSAEGVPTIGHAAIRAALARLAAMRPQMTMNVRRVVRTADDLAVVYNDWKMAAVDPNGREVTMAGKAIEVSRRQGDGGWLFAVDDPFARG